MKPSHLKTPRSLSECSFDHGYIFEEPESPMATLGHRVVSWVCFGAILACVALVYMEAAA
jgi:hypothetical protein